MNVEQIIAALGGADGAARVCGVSGSAIRKWRSFGRVPPKHWATVVRSGAATYEQLEQLFEAMETDTTAPPAEEGAA